MLAFGTSRATIADMYQDDSLTPDTILRDLNTKDVPRRVLCYAQVESTMTVAREQLRQQPVEAFPMLILAEEQSAGRGRMQRPWAGLSRKTLLFSLALHPRWNLRANQAPALIWLAGVSVCEAITDMTGLQPRLKWPNDILLPFPYQQSAAELQWGKVAGILLEGSGNSEQLHWAIIGCGLNVNASPTLPTPSRYPPIDLATALGTPIPRLPLLQAILRRMDFWYAAVHLDDQRILFQIWRELLITLGQTVEVETPTGTIHGLAEDVEPDGTLRIRDDSGAIHIVSNGDICG